MPSLTHLTLHLLGSLDAEASGPAGDRRLGKGKPAALLAYLSLAPGKRASREKLATLLWSDGSSEAARQNLRQTLWYLKRRLGEVVTADDDSVGLPAGTSSDVEEFLAASSRERYVDAIEGYRGDFIPDFAAPGAAAFEEWTDLERRRLRAILVGCAEAAARAALSGGHAVEALRFARRAREMAPDDQGAWRLLLECLIAGRDVLGITAALAQLEGEVERGDLDPDPAVRALMRTARKAAGSGDTEHDSAQSSEQSLVPDLIGREGEFRTLIDAWESARRGRGRALMLTGAAGLGKTRLLTDFAARVASTRGRTVFVRAHQGNRGIPGSLAAQIAESLAALPGAAAISPGSASVLVALSPLLATAFPGAAPDHATGEDAIRRRVTALGDLLSALCESSALALLLDDSHWADAESMRIVGALRARFEGTRALLVVASRIPDILRQYIGSTEEIALEPLDVAGVAEFVGRLANLPTEPWSHGLVPRLHEASHGIPLLLIETLQGLVERGALERRNGQWFASSADALQTAMPPGGALRARLASLEQVEQTALVRLATLGRPIEMEELAPDERVSDWAEVLGALERRNFVTRSENRVSVWHDEIGRGVLDQASPGERLDAHGWVSAMLVVRARSKREHALAMQHAVLSADDGRVRAAWLAGVRFSRASYERRRLPQLARELLGADASDEQVRRIVRTTPWEMRVGDRVRAAAAIAVLLIGAAAGFVTMRPAESTGMRAFVPYPDDSTQVVMFEIPEPEFWRGDEPFEGRLVPRERSPVNQDGNTRALQELPDGTGWVGVRTYPDSGGDEWIRVDNAGTITRLSTVFGDDGNIVPLRDGSGFIANTRRFDRVFHQSELVLLDSAGLVARRVASTDEEELDAMQSPDGTRFAFVRSFTSVVRSSEVCVVSYDGWDEHCVPAESPVHMPTVLGWSNSRTLVLQVQPQRLLSRLDVSSWQLTRIADSPCDLRPWNSRGVLSARCEDSQSKERWSGLASVMEPTVVRPLVVNGRRIHLSGGPGVLRQGDHRSRTLHRLRLRLADTVLVAGTTGSAFLLGTDSSGASLEVLAFRFKTSDSSIVRARPDGTLEARREGTAWIHATAGGWRSDSVRVHVRSPDVASRVVLSESWRSGLSSEWNGFGDPRPTSGFVGARAVLLPNGDGLWESGVASRREWNARQGLGLEAEVLLPITRTKFQRLSLMIAASGTQADISLWLNSNPPGKVHFTQLCLSGFPDGEGAQAFERFRVHTVDGRNAASAPLEDHAAFYSTQWHRVRLQLYPDGRCSLWVDGTLVGRTPDVQPLPPMARVVILGASVGTTIAVRGVEVWEGVRE